MAILREQISQLEDGLGRDLPDDFGQIVVYRSDSLAAKGETLQRAQQLVVVLQRGFVLILIVTAVAIAGTVLVARHRLRAARSPVARRGGHVRRRPRPGQRGARRGSRRWRVHLQGRPRWRLP